MIWKEHYKIGVEQIDEQHKQMLSFIEDLLRIAVDDAVYQKEKCKQIVGFFKDYAVFHFSTEEMFQEEIGFSERQTHKKLHVAFVEQLHEYELELIRTDYDRAVTVRLSGVMTRWWMYHIMREDKKMCREIPDTEASADESPVN